MKYLLIQFNMRAERLSSLSGKLLEKDESILLKIHPEKDKF